MPESGKKQVLQPEAVDAVGRTTMLYAKRMMEGGDCIAANVDGH